MTAIEIKNLSKSFGDNTIINNLTVTISTGTITSIMGSSGNGKSTLLKLITGQESFEGKINILGLDINNSKKDIYIKMGVSMDELGIYQNFTAKENILFFAKMFGVEKSKADDMLKKFGLDKDKNKKVKKFSKGMKQRLSLAVSMLKDPDILILDEPHTGLDEKNRELVNNLLTEIKNKGKTVIITTHSNEDAIQISDTIYELSKGSLINKEVA